MKNHKIIIETLVALDDLEIDKITEVIPYFKLDLFLVNSTSKSVDRM